MFNSPLGRSAQNTLDLFQLYTYEPLQTMRSTHLPKQTAKENQEPTFRQNTNYIKPSHVKDMPYLSTHPLNRNQYQDPRSMPTPPKEKNPKKEKRKIPRHPSLQQTKDTHLNLSSISRSSPHTHTHISHSPFPHMPAAEHKKVTYEHSYAQDIQVSAQHNNQKRNMCTKREG